MYIPKKRWQVYEKLMKQNLVTYYNNEHEEYCTDYLFGEKKWELDICRIAKLHRQDRYQVAMKFPTTYFQYIYIMGEIRGDVDCLGDTYDYFSRHHDYVSQWSRSTFWKDFKEKMKKSPLWQSCIDEEKKLNETLGLTQTKNIGWKNEYSEEYDDEKW